MFRTLAIKELREISWLIVVGWIVGLGWVGHHAGLFHWFGVADPASPRPIPFLGDQAAVAWNSLWIGSLVALVVALRQSYWESHTRTDQFLCSLPIPNATVLWTKIVVGAVATWTVPAGMTLAYAIWAAIPGTHASPFFWSWTADNWTITLLLVPVYLGALLIGYREARWWGSRVLPMCGVIGLVYFTFVAIKLSGEWGVGVLVYLALVAGLIAALREVCARRQKPAGSSLALATLIGVGAWIGVLFASYLAWSPFRAVRATPRHDRQYVAVLRDGTPAIFTEQASAPATVKTRDGRIPDSVEMARDARVPSLTSVPPVEPLFTTIAFSVDVVGKHGTAAANRRELWYLVERSADRRYLVGYDAATKRCVGFLSAIGYQTAPPTSEQSFAMSRVQLCQFAVGNGYEPYSLGVDSFRMPVGDQVYEIQLATRTSRPSAKIPAVLSLGPGRGDWLRMGTPLLAFTDQELLLESPDTSRTRRFHVPPDCRSQDAVVYFPEGSQEVMFVWKESTRNQPSLERWVVATYGEAGEKRRESITLTLRGDDLAAELSGWGGVAWEVLTQQAPVSEMLSVIVDVMSYDLSRISWREALRRSVLERLSALLVLFALAGVLATAALLHQRRLQLPAAWRWFWFVLIWGIPGFIGYWLHRRWPVRERCEACGQSAPRDRLACCHCGRDFPRPPRIGTEVFS